MEPWVVALIGSLFAGAGLKAVDHWLNRNKVKLDDATQIRGELRAEITALREEIRQLEADVEKWREQYYALLTKFSEQTTDLKIAQENLRREIERHVALDNPPSNV